MSESQLTTHELVVLEHLPETPQPISQRQIARKTGLSVGLINAVLKKLVTTGLVKTSRLNSRTIEYLLTPEGFAEKTLKSYHYIRETVRRYQSLYKQLVALLHQLEQEGFEKWYLYGEGELADLVIATFNDTGREGLSRELQGNDYQDIVILNASCENLEFKKNRVIDLTKILQQNLHK